MFIFAAALLLQLPASFDPNSCPHPYYWRETYRGPCKSRNELDKIVNQHRQWIESNRTAGKRADLHGAILSDDDLSNVDLWGADLSGTVLIGANLSGAIFGLRSQNGQISKAPPGSWVLAPPQIVSVEIRDENGNVTSSSSSQTDLQHSNISDADLRGSDLSYSRLDYSTLINSDLSNADLTGASLNHAYLVGTKLDHANLSNVDLYGAILEPSSVDHVVGIESAKNLDAVAFETNPSGLIQLRTLLRDQGLQEQERKLTYAINHQRARIASSAERWFQYIAFDFTCQYGMNPGRCLRIIAVLWISFAAFFYVSIHKKGWMRLRITRRFGNKERVREKLMWPQPDIKHQGMRRLIARLKFEWRAVRASVFFSLVNAFSIGYREFSIGQWLLLLSKRQYEIKPARWARSAAGAQSLLTVYLFALWILTYFGHPFD